MPLTLNKLFDKLYTYIYKVYTLLNIYVRNLKYLQEFNNILHYVLFHKCIFLITI